ncbi:hypothetical protein AUR64_07985 [Haloprofundus marisrubri]|uniref:Uncharacterized protein n=1 Tax=Haloprofundus marisrubri TaxID=1514971 RepID=A0A0W1RB57_9EURY|nr:hypothetical protein [Haloprofundus marisrubri]KTG10598.1 hypothetical protein AUR64_07985 [Haloprofundus marisrubri]
MFVEPARLPSVTVTDSGCGTLLVDNPTDEETRVQVNYVRHDEKFYVTVPAGESKEVEVEHLDTSDDDTWVRLFAYHGDEQIFVNGGPSDSAHPNACPSES